ncbi:MAG TPA: hypothetical protein VD886_22880 [Herpetosiphonaceae bacterium]|nr:hypothetical protein [Herpetosiphonaceae bacterium]
MDEQTATRHALDWFQRFYQPNAPVNVSADRQANGRWHLEITCESLHEVVRVEVDEDGQVERRIAD